jgi:integrase
MKGAYTWMSVDFHLLKRKDSKGKTIYHAAFLDAMPGKNGKPKYRAMRSTKTGRKDLAQKRAMQIIAEGRVFASKDSLRHYLLDFWTPEKSEYIRGKVAEGRKISASYCYNNQRLIENYFLPWFEARNLTKLSDLDRKTLTEWRNDLFEKGTLKEPTVNEKGEKVEPRRVSPTTQNKVRQAVFTALQWAVDMDMLPSHPGQGVRRVYEQKSERQIFQTAELGKLFSVDWSDIRAYAACMLAAETGMRLGEVRGLLFDNLHLEEGYLDIVTNYVDSEGLKPPKWDSVRLGMTFTPRCAMAIREVMRLHRWGAGEGRYVFYNIDTVKRPVAKLTIIKGLRDAMKAAKLPPGRTFHSFRHTLMSGGSDHLPVHVLQRMVGHSNDATTAKYQHVTDEQRQAMQDYQAKIIPFPKAN